MIPLTTLTSISKGDFIALNICLTTTGKCRYIIQILGVTFCYDYFYVIPASDVGIGKHGIMSESTRDCSSHPDKAEK